MTTSSGAKLPRSADVVIIGAGNAAFCAAHAAAEHGVSVLVLERAPEEESGGNSRFTAGAFRCVYDGVDDLRALMPDLTDEEVANTDFGTYTQDKFFDDMGRVTEYRTDPDLCDVLITRSKDTMLWMQKKGIRFIPIYGRQAYKIDGKFKFWGGLTVESWGGGPGLIEAHTTIAKKNGITVAYNARAQSLIADDDGVPGCSSSQVWAWLSATRLMALATRSCSDSSRALVAALSTCVPSWTTNHGVPCRQPVPNGGGADSPSRTTATLGLAVTKSSLGLLN